MSTKAVRIASAIAILFVAASAQAAQNAPTPGSDPSSGQNIQVLDLSTTPSTQDLQNAQQAFYSGNIIRMVGGTPADLRQLLGLGTFDVDHSAATGAPNMNTASQGDRSSQVVAVRAAANGALHQFTSSSDSSSPDAGPDGWQLDFAQWMDGEIQTALNPAAAGPGPPEQAWTQLLQLTDLHTDSHGSHFQNTLAVYRLNDISSAGDWYMVLTNPQSQPNYRGCVPLAFGDCGWWTHRRSVTMSTTPASILFDHGPLNVIENSTASFTIGGSLSSSGPGLDVSYSQTWEQPSVKTTDTSNLQSGTGQWIEDFTGQGFFGSAPPQTSTGLFLSHQGSIFQVPEKTKSFKLNLSILAENYLQQPFRLLNSSLYSNFFGVVSAPILAVNPPSVTIAPATGRSMQIVATIPSSTFGFPWQITNLPSWLTVSQLSGSKSTTVTLHVDPGTAVGSKASLNVNTDPAYAAPSVESNPLLVSVTVGEPDVYGVLLAGGEGPRIGGANVLDSANLFSPASGDFIGLSQMSSPRANHTATLLADGTLLMAGGHSSALSILATAELYDPHTATFSPVRGSKTCPGGPGCMVQARELHTATRLRDGRVLITGGQSETAPSLASAELYDPATQTFTATGNMTSPRLLHTAILLPTGDVLIFGGLSSRTTVATTAELYHPATGTFTLTSGNPVTPRRAGTAILLNNGSVLITGAGVNGAVTSAEIYDPASQTFTPTGNMQVPRLSNTATLLASGQVLIAGGRNGVPSANLASAELYDPNTRTFTLLSGAGVCPGTPGCLTAARSSHTATLLLNGKVLLAGGMETDNETSLGSTDIFDPASNTFAAGPSFVPRARHTASLLQGSTSTSLSSSLNPSRQGQNVTFTAAVTSPLSSSLTGAVTFKDGSTILGTSPLTNGTASFSTAALGTATHLITASYNGNDTFAASTSSSLPQEVGSNPTTISVTSSLHPSHAGDLVTFTARLSHAGHASPTGTVTFTDEGVLLGSGPVAKDVAMFSTASLAVGSHLIQASYSGDKSFSGSESLVITQLVRDSSTATTLQSSSNPANYGDSITFLISVSSHSGIVPSGAVVLKDGSSHLGTGALIGGQLELVVAGLQGGVHQLTATYEGNNIFPPSTSPVLSQRVNALPSTTHLSSSPNPSDFGHPVTFEAHVSSEGGTPTGTVTFKSDNAVLGSAELHGGIASFVTTALRAGTHRVVAVFSGDGNFAESTSRAITQTVNPGLVVPNVVVTSDVNPSLLGETVVFTARVTSKEGGVPSGSITISEGERIYGSSALTNGVGHVSVSSLGSGLHLINATYGGDATHKGATSPTYEQIVNAPR